MRISVSMAVYNGEPFIIEQLDSIRNQTRQVDEVIMCDDQSKDRSVEIVRQYIDKYELTNWKIIVNDNNLGYADNFHKAMTLSTGDIIVFCDQDDIWMKDRIEKMERCFAENNEILVLYSEFDLFYTSDNVPKIDSPVLRDMKRDGSVEKTSLSSSKIFIKTEGCTMALRKKFLEETESYWFSGFAHDEYVWKMALCKDGLYVLHESTLKRRIHRNNVSTIKLHDFKKRVSFLENLNRGHKSMLAFAKKCQMNEKEIKLIEDNVKSSEMRVQLMRDKKIYYVIPLIFKYSHCYYSRKAIPVELLMAIRG